MHNLGLALQKVKNIHIKKNVYVLQSLMQLSTVCIFFGIRRFCVFFLCLEHYQAYVCKRPPASAGILSASEMTDAVGLLRFGPHAL